MIPFPAIFCRPDGTKKIAGHQIPTINCRAIFKCPYGTGTVARQKGRERPKVRSRTKGIGTRIKVRPCPYYPPLCP